MSLIISPSPTKALPGCVNCGRGTYNPEQAPVAIPAEKAQALKEATALVVVPCTLSMNHVAGDPHALKCTGMVYVHRDVRVCTMVQTDARRT